MKVLPPITSGVNTEAHEPHTGARGLPQITLLRAIQTQLLLCYKVWGTEGLTADKVLQTIVKERARERPAETKTEPFI